MVIVKHARVTASDNSHRGAISGIVQKLHIQIDDSFVANDFYQTIISHDMTPCITNMFKATSTIRRLCSLLS